MMLIQAVILDFNGTLVESASKSAYMGQLLREWARENKKDPKFVTEFNRQLPVKSLRGFLKDFDISWEEVHEWVGENYDPSLWREAPGASDTLKILHRQYRLEIISNSMASFVGKLVEHLEWGSLIRYIGTREFAVKPDLAAFHCALRELQVSAAESVAVGDNDKDLYPLEHLGGFGIQCGCPQFASIPDIIAARQFRKRHN